MDILTHTLSGIAIGTVVSSFSKEKLIHRLKIVLISGFAGALPDIDVISLWSQFDTTIGAFFHLDIQGRNIYSAKYWYSHHAFMHSLFASIFFAILFNFILYGIYSIFKKQNAYNFLNFITKNKLVSIGFILGFTIHLIEDMPTPASTWGGVNFLWPSKSYIGGTGDIWWWNNYDIFLIVVCVIILNMFFMLINRFIKFDVRKTNVLVFVLGFILIFYQIKTRNFDFAYSGYSKNYQKFEKKSKELQKNILGKTLYSLMEKFDNKLRIYF